MGGICPEGKIPYLYPTNYETWLLFQQMLSGLIVPQGGYDFSAIKVIMDCNNIETSKRPELTGIIIKLIDVIEAERRARNK